MVSRAKATERGRSPGAMETFIINFGDSFTGNGEIAKKFARFDSRQTRCLYSELT